MNARAKGLLLAAVHLALVASLGAKLLWDRAHCPRAWVKAAPVDPDLPIRGRYVSLRVEVPVTGANQPPQEPPHPEPWWRPFRGNQMYVALSHGPEGLRAQAVPDATAHPATLSPIAKDLPKERWTVTLDEPLAFFIPDHVPDPSRRPAGEELWVEVTLPKKGPLRPIRLGVKGPKGFSPLRF